MKVETKWPIEHLADTDGIRITLSSGVKFTITEEGNGITVRNDEKITVNPVASNTVIIKQQSNTEQ